MEIELFTLHHSNIYLQIIVCKYLEIVDSEIFTNNRRNRNRKIKLPQIQPHMYKLHFSIDFDYKVDKTTKFTVLLHGSLTCNLFQNFNLEVEQNHGLEFKHEQF